ncbi:MAG: hypothetical protein LC676_09635 [Loktanella sp.]|nr:hypothetical protein [Loktanella sp.]
MRQDAPGVVDDLASFALSRVATRKVYTSPANPKPDVTLRLLESVMDRSHEAHRAVVSQMLETGISPEAIADIYIPEVARQMGTEWEADVSGFAQVTLGSYRLQVLLRDLDEIWDTGFSGIGVDTRNLVRVMTVPGAQHTLGASVVSTQLRRLGCSVRLQVGRSDADDDSQNGPDRCDAIFISASRSDPLGGVAVLIAGLRGDAMDPPPIVLGGTLLDAVENAKTATGADFVTLDPVAALEFCGIMPTLRVGQ